MKFIPILWIALLTANFSLAVESIVTIVDLPTTVTLLEQGAVFVDNRPEYKYKAGHIKGAVNLPFFQKQHPSNRMTKEKLLQVLGDKKMIVFYCSGAFRAYHALLQAKEWEIEAELHWYKNGMAEWMAAKLPVIK